MLGKVDERQKENVHGATAAYEDRAIAALRAAGFRITMPRVQVIRALASAEKALSAYAIHDAIISGGGMIDVVSVYRIIATLQSLNLAHSVGLLGGDYVRSGEGSKLGECTLLVDTEAHSAVEVSTLDRWGDAGRLGYRIVSVRLECIVEKAAKAVA